MLSRLVSRSSCVRRSNFGCRSFSTGAFRKSSPMLSQDQELNWVERTRSAPADLIAKYKEVSSLITDLKTGVTDVKVPTIDWGYWEKEISDKSVVSKLRKEYESQKFDVHSVSEAEIKQQNVEYDEKIAAAEQRIAANALRMKEHETSIAKSQYYVDHPERFTLQALYEMAPGLEEELRQQWWDGHYVLDAEERKNAAWDPNGLIAFFESGGKLSEVPASLKLPHPAQKIGDFDLLEWAKAEEAAQAKNGMKVDIVSRLPKFRTPKTHHELLPILQERKDGAPIFGAPVPGHPEGSQSH